jgi:hypothetical protein
VHPSPGAETAALGASRKVGWDLVLNANTLARGKTAATVCRDDDKVIGLDRVLVRVVSNRNGRRLDVVGALGMIRALVVARDATRVFAEARVILIACNLALGGAAGGEVEESAIRWWLAMGLSSIYIPGGLSL